MTPETLAELAIPPYRLVLPAGWEEAPASSATAQLLIAQGSEVMKRAHRPDLDVEFRSLVRRGFAQLSAAGAVSVYLQSDVPPEQIMPVSIVVSVRRAPEGGTLDPEVTAMFREGGAGFLRDDRAIVRMEADRAVDGVGGGVRTRQIAYVIAVPGTGRTLALQFTTAIPYPVDGDGDGERMVEEMVALSDVCMSTFAWEAA